MYNCSNFLYQVLPSGWIIEPVKRDKKVFSMATYIMQVCILKGNIINNSVLSLQNNLKR